MQTDVVPRTVMRHWAVLLPVLLGCAVILVRYHQPALTTDGVTYLQIARNILLGKGLGWQASWVPPLHSVLIASAAYLAGTRDLLAAAGIISPAMYLGLIAAVYGLARELFDLRTALVASCLCALSPHLLFIAFSPEAEITYAFFLTLSLLLVTRNLSRQSVAGAAVAGISFSLAWLARSEGLIVMLSVFACLVAFQGTGFLRTKRFRNCLVALLFFTLAATPYLLFLKKQYGAWVLSPKSSYVQIWMKGRIYHDHAQDELHNEELWGLTKDGSKLRWQEPAGVTDLARYLLTHPARNLRVYLHNLAMELPGRIPNNSGMEGYPQLYPVYLALAALLALFLPWGERAVERRTILLAPLLILLVLPVFTEGWWKYLVPYLPVIMILAARGITGGAEYVCGKFPGQHSAGLPAVLASMVAVIIGIRFAVAYLPIPFGESTTKGVTATSLDGRRVMVEEVMKAGRWGASRFGPGRNYMVRWNKIVYYLDGLWTAFPVAEVSQIVGYARRNKVDYIVVELSVPPDEAAMRNPPEGLKVAGMYQSIGVPYVAVFYQVVH